MEFAAAVLMLSVFYVRPQEWIDLFATVRTFLLAQVFALVALVMRPGRMTLGDFFKTPHDWMMLAYWVWIVWNSTTSSWETFKATFPSFFLYVAVVQAISTRTKLLLFLTWWGGMIYFIAFMAVAAEYGFDPAGSRYISHAKEPMVRIVFNNGMFDNPNALGHSVAPVVAIIYFLMFWKRPVFVKEGALALWFLPFYCVYLTASKGAFVSAFVGVLAALLFGRALITQIILIVLAATVGWGAMQLLPRFGEVKWGEGRSDEAIRGRLQSLDWGYKKLQTSSTGVGWYQYIPTFTREDPDKAIAPHNAYNMVGAELGYGGLFLFIGILYCCVRSVITVKTEDVDEERIRRVVFVLTLSYAASGWVIDFAYRATFFLVVATAAAFHRVMLAKNVASETKETDELAGFRAVRATRGAGRLFQPTPAFAGVPSAMGRQMLQPRRLAPGRGATVTEPDGPRVFMKWKRIGIVDIILMYVLTEQLISFWLWYKTNA